MTEKLKELRVMRNLTQQEVADTLGIDRRQYSRYETGRNEIPLRHIKKICVAYNISADWMLGLAEEL